MQKTNDHSTDDSPLKVYRLEKVFQDPESCAAKDVVDKQLIGFKEKRIHSADWLTEKADLLKSRTNKIYDKLIWFLLKGMEVEAYCRITRSDGRIYYVDPFGVSNLRKRVLLRMDRFGLCIMPYYRANRYHAVIIPNGSMKPNGRLPARVDELCDPLADALGLLKTLETSTPSQVVSLLSAFNLGESISCLCINLRFAGHIRMPGLRAVSSKAEKKYQEAVTVYQNCQYVNFREGFEKKEAALYKAAEILKNRPTNLKSRLSKGRQKYGIWPVEVGTENIE